MYHTRLSHRRGLTHSSQPKRKKGGILISKSSIPVHTSIYMVFKKNRQSQPIISNDSTISSRLQMKLNPTGPFHNKSTQTLGILLVKVIFLPQITQISPKSVPN